MKCVYSLSVLSLLWVVPLWAADILFNEWNESRVAGLVELDEGDRILALSVSDEEKKDPAVLKRFSREKVVWEMALLDMDSALSLLKNSDGSLVLTGNVGQNTFYLVAFTAAGKRRWKSKIEIAGDVVPEFITLLENPKGGFVLAYRVGEKSFFQNLGADGKTKGDPMVLPENIRSACFADDNGLVVGGGRKVAADVSDEERPVLYHFADVEKDAKPRWKDSDLTSAGNVWRVFCGKEQIHVLSALGKRLFWSHHSKEGEMETSKFLTKEIGVVGTGARVSVTHAAMRANGDLWLTGFGEVEKNDRVWYAKFSAEGAMEWNKFDIAHSTAHESTDGVWLLKSGGVFSARVNDIDSKFRRTAWLFAVKEDGKATNPWRE